VAVGNATLVGTKLVVLVGMKLAVLIVFDSVGIIVSLGRAVIVLEMFMFIDGTNDGDELGEKDEMDGLFVALIEGLSEGAKLKLIVGDAGGLFVGKMEGFCVG